MFEKIEGDKMESRKIKVIQYGIGEMGSEAVRQIIRKRDLELVACIDHYTGIDIDVGRVVGLKRDIGIKVTKNAGEVFNTVKADVLLHCTVSEAKGTFQQTRGAIEAGINFITIAERSAYPWLTEPQLTEEIDELAQNKGVSFLGTGLNPGIMMDYIPLTLTSVMRKVDNISVSRVIDCTKYGRTVWEHFGMGKPIREFNAGITKGEIVLHVGFTESSRIMAEALGWVIDDYHEEHEPYISDFDRQTKFGLMGAGTVWGWSQTAHVFMRGKEVMTLQLIVVAGPRKGDKIEIATSYSIDGIPGVEAKIAGEFAGQGGWGTAAHAVNSIPRVIAARPGLITGDELPPSPCLPLKESGC
jgi:4-hydroxy-tetrahydrodipicolinate reductase